MASEAIVATAENLEHAVNCMGDGEDMEYIVNSMLNLHRTLNQAFTGRMIIPFVRGMAARYAEGQYDARNEAACKTCAAMWEAAKKLYGVGDDCAFRLPLI